MAVTVRPLPSRKQRERIARIAAKIASAPQPYGGQEQQRQQQRPAAVGVLVMPPTVVGREIFGQRRFQRIYQTRLVGGG